MAARGPEGLVRKSSPSITGSHRNYSNRHNREKRGPGWWPREGRRVGWKGGKTSSLRRNLHRCRFTDLPASTLRPHPRPPPSAVLVRRLTFPALPGGSSPECRVTLRGRQRTRSTTVRLISNHTLILATYVQHLFSGEVKQVSYRVCVVSHTHALC